MTIIILGATGFIGSHVMRCAMSRGHDVIGTTRSRGTNDLVPFDLAHDRIHDRIDFARITNGSVWVINTITFGGVDTCFRNRQQSHQVNVEHTQILADDISSVNARHVFLSSSYVFDGTSVPNCETDELSPLNDYGTHKELIENYLKDNSPESIVLRFDKVVGNRQDENHLLSDWHTASQAGKPILCWNGQTLSPTLVDDVALAICLACENELSGLYHVANPENFSRFEVIQQFLNAAGADNDVCNVDAEALGFADKRPLKSWLDPSRFIAATGMNFTPVSKIISTFLA